MLLEMFSPAGEEGRGGGGGGGGGEGVVAKNQCMQLSFVIKAMLPWISKPQQY